MFNRVIFYLTTLLTILILFTTQDVFAQRRIGITAYVVRDETVKIMSAEEMKKIVCKLKGVTLDHIKLPDWKRDNTLRFGLGYSCGTVGDLELISGGKKMRLLFDTREHNTY